MCDWDDPADVKYYTRLPADEEARRLEAANPTLTTVRRLRHLSECAIMLGLSDMCTCLDYHPE